MDIDANGTDVVMKQNGIEVDSTCVVDIKSSTTGRFDSSHEVGAVVKNKIVFECVAGSCAHKGTFAVWNNDSGGKNNFIAVCGSHVAWAAKKLGLPVTVDLVDNIDIGLGSYSGSD